MKAFVFLAAVSVAALVSPGRAAVIDFNELTTTTFVNPANPTVSGGFNFVANFDSPSALGVWGTGTGFSIDATGASIFHNFGNTVTTVTKVGGGIFDFHSIDLGDVYNNGTGGMIELTFTDGMGTTSQSVTLDNAVGGQTFTFNRVGLTAFTLNGVTTQGRWMQFDNVVVDASIGAVPEPASWALMIAGFGLVGSAMRRRKHSVSVRFA